MKKRKRRTKYVRVKEFRGIYVGQPSDEFIRVADTLRLNRGTNPPKFGRDKRGLTIKWEFQGGVKVQLKKRFAGPGNPNPSPDNPLVFRVSSIEVFPRLVEQWRAAQDAQGTV